MKWFKYNEEVIFPNQTDFVVVSKKDVEYLREVALSNPRQRARYCTHSSTDEKVHEMLIYHKKGTYVRPHKHIAKTESFHLIYGEADVIIFDEEGNLDHVLSLGNYESGKTFYYRVPESVYHTQIFRKDSLFHEVTRGPFDNKDTVCPNWSPAESDHHLVNEFVDKLNLQLKALLN